MNIVATVNQELLKQDFSHQEECGKFQQIEQTMYGYSKLENCIAIISDFRTNKSRMYYGGIADKLGVPHTDESDTASSIWVDKILSRIHPDDLLEKHGLELQYIRYLKDLSPDERSRYYMAMHLRMLDKAGNYVGVYHRIYSVSFAPDNLSLALCFYNIALNNYIPDRPEGMIVNSISGEVIKSDKTKCETLLTAREKEVLFFIEQGKMSKEIAELLSISKNTVDRHRQNIFQKLRVKNSMEACRIAKGMGIL